MLSLGWCLGGLADLDAIALGGKAARFCRMEWVASQGPRTPAKAILAVWKQPGPNAKSPRLAGLTRGVTTVQHLNGP